MAGSYGTVPNHGPVVATRSPDHWPGPVGPIVETYHVGVMTGVPGRPAEVLPETYVSYEATLHAIFLRRVARLREEA